ncbi:hypothetical protein D3C86_1180510 [compost metagenome]
MTMTLDQYITLVDAAQQMAVADPDWQSSTDRYFLFSNGKVVTADPYQNEIEGGAAFIGFKKYTAHDGVTTVRPLIRRSRVVQVMDANQQAAEAMFLEGDYISKGSIRILGYTMYEGMFIENEGARWEVICFTEIANLLNDTELNDLPNVVLHNRNTGHTVAHSVGPWLTTLGERESAPSTQEDNT